MVLVQLGKLGDFFERMLGATEYVYVCVCVRVCITVRVGGV